MKQKKIFDYFRTTISQNAIANIFTLKEFQTFLNHKKENIIWFKQLKYLKEQKQKT